MVDQSPFQVKQQEMNPKSFHISSVQYTTATTPIDPHLRCCPHMQPAKESMNDSFGESPREGATKEEFLRWTNYYTLVLPS